MPKGYHLSANFDTTISIEDNVHELELTIVLAAILTSLVCYFFWEVGRPPLIFFGYSHVAFWNLHSYFLIWIYFEHVYPYGAFTFHRDRGG